MKKELKGHRGMFRVMPPMTGTGHIHLITIFGWRNFKKRLDPKGTSASKDYISINDGASDLRYLC
jgi:hypothetical protein